MVLSFVERHSEANVGSTFRPLGPVPKRATAHVRKRLEAAAPDRLEFVIAADELRILVPVRQAAVIVLVPAVETPFPCIPGP